MVTSSENPKSVDRRARVYLPYLGLNYRPISERIVDFREAIFPFDEERAKYEASRCIHCPDPAPCVEGCPVNNDIPGALWHIERGEFIEAALLFRETNALPEICGRICPQELLCEQACVHNTRQEPIHIGALETFVTDYQHLESPYQIPLSEKSGHKIAVVGGGPAGLSCAERLVEKGHSVTVFDGKPIPGGLLVYGIPVFKLHHSVLLGKLKQLSEAGVTFVNNTLIGIDKTVQDLLDEGFEAVFIGVGTGVDNKIGIPGEGLSGVYYGTEFLIRAGLDLEKLPRSLSHKASRPQVGKRVYVVGGGDTAYDCIRTAIRLGGEEVVGLYRRTEKEMPGKTKDRQLAMEEGGRYEYLVQPVRFFAGEDGNLTAIECVKIELGELDETGRPAPLPVEGSNFILEADTVILALGYGVYPTIGSTTPCLNRKPNGLIIVDPETGVTSCEGIYAGGDVVSGPYLVVTAVADGQRAAKAIDEYLQTRGVES